MILSPTSRCWRTLVSAELLVFLVASDLARLTEMTRFEAVLWAWGQVEEELWLSSLEENTELFFGLGPTFEENHLAAELEIPKVCKSSVSQESSSPHHPTSFLDWKHKSPHPILSFHDHEEFQYLHFCSWDQHWRICS